ncbi:MAG: YicC family protein [Oscillospiraceae bacterium]|nr:YicC family protein [Oscillospiraceae bacterium]
MIRSMTGFGRGEATVDGRDITVEIKSVNHRYFEFNCRTTRGFGFLEEKLKSYIKERVSRGKIDMFVSLSQKEDTEAIVKINPSLARGYINALKKLSDEYGVKDDISVSTVSSYSDIFQVHKAPEDEEEVWNSVKPVLDTALNNFITMRETEGEKMKADVMSRAKHILSIVDEIESRSPERVKEYEARLKERIEELLGSADYDEQRVITEVAIFADKVAVDEETVRLRSHFDQLKTLMDGDGEVGRKLDFIIQEMNREANTIGSKANDSNLSHMVVDIKAEIEKIREQIQNIE